MQDKPRTSRGKVTAASWDGMTFMERVDLIIEHADLFWSLRLVTEEEITAVLAMHESEREYIMEREEQPLFTGVHPKQTLAAQHQRERLQAALKAVFE